MPNIPIRELGSAGIISDRRPYDLPPNAWSSGNNIRFHNGKIMRSPAHRTLESTLTEDPWHIFGVKPRSGGDYIIYASEDGNLYKWLNGTSTDYSVAAFSPATSTLPYTSHSHGHVTYINRGSHVPAYLTESGSQFADLPDWDSTWRAHSLRGFKDYLVALNITKSSTQYSTMVKWSSPATEGAPPTSWDETDATELAGENTLAGMHGELKDGCGLKDAFILYSDEEVWLMEYIGGTFLFDFRKLFDDDGIINTNCAVEVQGKHYVFGFHDIYVHDGISKQSICDGLTRSKIYSELNYADSGKFFVTHNDQLQEIYFYYQSGDADASWASGSHNNRVAAYNYVNGTWSFRDAPNVSSATQVNVTSTLASQTYEDLATETYSTYGGQYQSQEDGADRSLIVARVADTSVGLTGSKLYAVDPIELNSSVPLPIDEDVLNVAYVERIGMDLDDILGAPIGSYKTYKRILPQARVLNSGTMNVYFGSSMYPEGAVTWTTPVTFDPETQYKVDIKKGGRYPSIRFEVTGAYDFEITGFDLEANVNMRR